HDPRQRAAPARAVDHLTAGGRRTDVVLGADQEQHRNAGAPSQPRRDAAVRIKRDRRAEIRLDAARRQLRAYRPQQRAGAVRPSDEADAVACDPGLLHQPLPGSKDVRDPFAAGEYPALPVLDAALRTELMRTIRV